MNKQISLNDFVNKSLTAKSSPQIEDLTRISQLIRIFVLTWQVYSLVANLNRSRNLVSERDLLSEVNRKLLTLLICQKDLLPQDNFLASIDLQKYLSFLQQTLQDKQKDQYLVTQELEQKLHLIIQRISPQAFNNVDIFNASRTDATLVKTKSSLPFVITVGGTNGKGTTCAFLTSLLKDLQVITLTSPHLLDYRERILFNGEKIAENFYLWGFKILEDLLALFLSQTEQSHEVYFNFSQQNTLLAQLFAYLFEVDVLIQEVGIGGLLDATNTLDAHLAVITSVDLDHINMLGNSHKEIAENKIAIARKAGKVIYLADESYLAQEIKEQLDFLKLFPKDIVKTLAGKSNYVLSNLQAGITAYNYLFTLKEEQDVRIGVKERFSLGRLNDFTTKSRSNITRGSLELRSPNCFSWALQHLNLTPLVKGEADFFHKAIESIKLYGRFSVLNKNGKKEFFSKTLNYLIDLPLEQINVIFDVGHNPAAVKQTCQKLLASFTGKNIYLLSFGLEKDITSCLEQIKALDVNAEIILLPIKHELRGVTLEQQLNRLPANYSVKTVESLTQALESCLYKSLVERNEKNISRDIKQLSKVQSSNIGKIVDEIVDENSLEGQVNIKLTKLALASEPINLVIMGSFYLLADICSTYNFALTNDNFLEKAN
ncbi:hypothetical protein CKF54_00800 [Psittacicella hinzii]|uniref:Uncharacterized protein n=1 Tax=Psittacicella hinzii TaxID=2028575 RepID=A0A3A1Y9U3_9GAMM|nr:Mur ligase family protein [Psittacicella hinzii]RIY34311.1 hypothetical protein CKF54_00800 [Psittacicella hinzii]